MRYQNNGQLRNFPCKLCHRTVLGNIYSHFSVLHHSIHDLFRCGVKECYSEYRNLKNLLKHHRLVHLPRSQPELIWPAQESEKKVSIEELPFLENEPEINIEPDEIPVPNVASCNDAAVIFLGGLLSEPDLSVNKVFMIAGRSLDILDPLIHYLTLKVLPALLPSLQTELQNVLQNYSNQFSNVSTYRKLIVYMEKKGYYIPPKPYIIDKGNKDHQYLTTQYIPLKETIAKFLELPGVFDVIKKNHGSSNNGILASFVDGALWQKRKQRDERMIIPLLHYYDDFETANPLGSKAAIHKIGGNYSMILALPPRFNSSLENIFLTTLFYSEDRRESNIHVYDVVVAQYQNLARDGK